MNTQLHFFENAPNDLRKCCHCKKYLELNQFTKDRRRKDGLNKCCKKCGSEFHKRWKQRNPGKTSNKEKEWRIKIRYTVLRHYSNKLIPECDCCHENHIEFLAIDHIYGNGNKHRKAISKNNVVGSSTAFYRWLIKNNYPKGFRVMCNNCNQSLGAYGYCPHRAEHAKAQG